MILIFKLFIGFWLIYYVFKAIFGDLFVAFYKPATETAVKAIEEEGLEHYVKWDAIDRFCRHMILIVILVRLLFGAINYEKHIDENGKEVYTVSVGENFENIY